MEIIVNGKPEETTGENLADYIRTKGLNPEALVVEHNGRVISTEIWSKTRLCDGDKLELLSFVGGG